MIAYPPHEPRASDPHYGAFEAYRAATAPTARCWWATQTGIQTLCQGGLELHHGVVDYAAINAVDPKLLGVEYPDAGSTQDAIDLWVNSSPENLVWLCEHHHRGAGSGAHTVPYAVWKSSLVAPTILP